MNKKFSTLVASLLLASSVGAYAQWTSNSLPGAIVTTETIQPVVAGVKLPAYNSSLKSGGYEVGKAYFLSTGSEEYLMAVEDDGVVGLYSVPVPSSEFSSVEEVNAALWELTAMNAPAGAIAPTYVFVNKATNTVLSLDKGQAVSVAFDAQTGALTQNSIDALKVASNILGGDQTEWLSAPSYKDPAQAKAPIYASVANDNVVVLVKGYTDLTTGISSVVLAKAPASSLLNTAFAQLITVTPQILNPAGNTTFPLTPNQLNTMLGMAGKTATEDSYFQLTFDPEATMNGGENKLAVDLQAMAVSQFELAYYEEASSDNVKTPSSRYGRAYYASFYPKTSKQIGTDTYSDLKDPANVVGYRSAVNSSNVGTVWFALKNRDNQYLVVDTSYVDGTSQDANKRITFNWAGLYNAKNDTRYRDPRSYLFQFLYNPQTGNVDIKSMAYVSAKDTKVGTQTGPAAYENPLFYEDGYVNQPLKDASEWYASANNVVENAYVSRAALGSVSEVTLGGEEDVLPTGVNAFNITLGNSSRYQLTYVPSGVYLMKVTGSQTKDRIGKYYVNNLKGGFEVMEQAVRQNFQDMPAAQWIVVSSGSSAGAPIAIANREFENIIPPSSTSKYLSNGVPFGVAGAAGIQAFTMGSDTIEFVPVVNKADKYLGYKYVANDTIAESTFTFNYLHDLAMDKPINTVNDKDSVVWVDKNGDVTNFVLEAVFDDTYGTNGDLTGVANLVRRVYKIKVNDASKLQNDGRYLAYDKVSKKYKVSNESADLFYIKENNEVTNGECYYTLIKANEAAAEVVLVSKYNNASNKVTNRLGWIALDDEYVTDANHVLLANYGTYYSKVDGVSNHEGYDVALFDTQNAATAAAKATVYPSTAVFAVKQVVETLSQDEDVAAGQIVLGELASDMNTIYDQKYVVELIDFKPANYAFYKVSVDNNTLNLVNGVLNDQSSQEVATSAFAVKRDAAPLYRRFNTELEGAANDDPKTLKFFRVNAATPEYLYEDANSKYSAELGFNFLGIEGKGDSKNAAIYVDTAYVDRGTRMPQYMLALRPNYVQGETKLCDASTHKHATKEEALACEHSYTTPSYLDAWYLVNLQDSVEVGNAVTQYSNKFQWNKQYTRLGFVEARHIGDTLVIKNSVYTGNLTPLKKGSATTVASKDTIDLANNLHKNVVFSFRLLKNGSNDFLIESESEGLNAAGTAYEYKKNADLEAARIAPMKGGWLKIQNGVPVIASNMSYNEAGLEAEIFNVEKTDEDPTANEAVEAAEVSVVAAQGAIIVKGAAGKVVTVANILGQTIANQVAASDNVTIAAPAGVAVVTVDGEATKVVVK